MSSEGLGLPASAQAWTWHRLPSDWDRGVRSGVRQHQAKNRLWRWSCSYLNTSSSASKDRPCQNWGGRKKKKAVAVYWIYFPRVISCMVWGKTGNYTNNCAMCGNTKGKHWNLHSSHQVVMTEETLFSFFFNVLMV